jgi:1,4-alpha-glucan branching enzyme
MPDFDYNTPYEQQFYVNAKLPVWNYSFINSEVREAFQNGTLYNAYEFFGSHFKTVNNIQGYYFAVWAPNAKAVAVVGNFNNWQANQHPLFVKTDNSGIWEGFIPNFKTEDAYKYAITTATTEIILKADPYARYAELRPNTASKTYTDTHTWTDQKWMQTRAKHNALNAPWSVYEVHLPSWQRPQPNNEDSYNSYQQLIKYLVPYVKKMGFTHVELMPVTEYPFDGSWGYQCLGYFAPTARFGNPQNFKQLVQAFHNNGIGVILDWVPSHFPGDAHGLYKFDGEHTYEYADMRKGFHPDWNSYIFNYSRAEVRSFLISSARFWFHQFHIDGIRVDAVSSILRLDYSRKEGEWEPNIHGQNGNLEAIAFLKEMNEMIYRDFPDVQTIAEEATDWPQISAPTNQGGIGFGMKWMMGWMHDTLDYFKTDPLYRQHQQNKFSFSMMYFYDENFMLPLSHDEVVHGKSPMLYKMPGDEWQKFANLRLLYTYMYTHPGAKLLFMGNEFGQTSEWNYKQELQWHLLQYQSHQGMQNCVQALNQLYKKQPALHQLQFSTTGFEWIDLDHRAESIIAYKRKGTNPKQDVVIILNLTPVVRHNYTLTYKGKKLTKEVFNSDVENFYGTNTVTNSLIINTTIDAKNNTHQLIVNLPALAAIILM